MGQEEDRLGWGANHCNLIGHEEEVGFSSQCPAVSQMGIFSPQLPLVATAQKEQEVADSVGLTQNMNPYSLSPLPQGDHCLYFID